MASFADRLTDIVSKTFTALGFDSRWSSVSVSDRPDLGQFQTNGALVAAKILKANPREIAERIVEQLAPNAAFRNVSVAGRGSSTSPSQMHFSPSSSKNSRSTIGSVSRQSPVRKSLLSRYRLLFLVS